MPGPCRRCSLPGSIAPQRAASFDFLIPIHKQLPVSGIDTPTTICLQISYFYSPSGWLSSATSVASSSMALLSSATAPLQRPRSRHAAPDPAAQQPRPPTPAPWLQGLPHLLHTESSWCCQFLHGGTIDLPD